MLERNSVLSIMFKPKITIITVMFNVEDSVEETILSILNQKYENIEYIVVDGESTDRTMNIVNRYSEKITHIVSEKDTGIYNAMNKGVQLATGDYLYFLNSGDTFVNGNIIGDIVKELDSNIDFLYGKVKFLSKDGRVNYIKGKKISKWGLRIGRKVGQQTMLVRRVVFNKVGGLNEKYKIAADFDLLCKILDNDYLVKRIDTVICNYDNSGISSDLKKSYGDTGRVIRDRYGDIFYYLYKIVSTVMILIHRIYKACMNLFIELHGKLGFISKLKDLLQKKERKNLLKVLFVDLCVALFQAIGILSILPFLNLVMNPSSIEENLQLNYIFETLEFTSFNKFSFFLGVLVLVIIVTGNVISAIGVKLKNEFIWDINHRISTSLLRRYVSLPYKYFLNSNSMDLGKNVLNEVHNLTGNFLLYVMNIAEGLVLSFVIILMLLLVNPWVTMASVFFIGFIYFFIYLLFSKKLKGLGKERLEENMKRYKVVGEAIGGIKYTKVLGKESYFLNEFSIHSEKYAKFQSWYAVISKTPKYVMEIISFGGVLGLVLYYIYMDRMSSQVIPLIGLFAFAGYRLMPAIQSVYDAFTGFRFHRPVLNKIHYDMFEGGLKEAKLFDTGNFPKSLQFKKDIEINNISFSYDGNRNPVLENINMGIKKDMSIGIVGSTGSGKTTLVDIILGLLTPTEGNMYVDNIKITEDNIRNWQANLGYVPQDIFLCDDTITKNIAFGYDDSKIDMEQVRKVAKMANIDQFIEEELPDKYDTIIGERGIRLSGGQRQRIGIARALYHDPQVLVFDEATSSLDNLTEKGVLKAIEDVSRLKTIILIAHRLTTVKNCDCIYLLDKGKIIDSGRYNELVMRNKKFKEMTGEAGTDLGNI